MLFFYDFWLVFYEAGPGRMYIRNTDKTLIPSEFIMTGQEKIMRLEESALQKPIRSIHPFLCIIYRMPVILCPNFNAMFGINIGHPV